MIAVLFWASVLLLVYTYLGYPLMVFLLARFVRPERYGPAQYPDICLLVSAYNEDACITAKLENSLALDYPAEHMHLMVAAHGSTDRTVEIVESYASRGVELAFHPEREGKLAAITRAMEGITAEIVVFSDANNLYAPDTLRALVAPFSDARVGAVSGAKIIRRERENSLGDSEGLYWKYESFIKRQESRFSSCVGSSGEIFAIRKRLFEPPRRNLVNDDFYMAMQTLRKGYRVVYAPGARSCELVSASQADEVTRRKRISAGRYQSLWNARGILPLKQPVIMWQIISHKFLRLLLPFAMLAALAASLLSLLLQHAGTGYDLLSLGFPWNQILFGLQALFYLSAVIGMLSRSGSRPARLLHIPAFLLSSNYAVFLGLFHFLQNRNPALWEKVSRTPAGEVHSG